MKLLQVIEAINAPLHFPSVLSLDLAREVKEPPYWFSLSWATNSRDENYNGFFIPFLTETGLPG